MTVIFENKISWNTVITGGIVVLTWITAWNGMSTQNALQDVRIEANRVAMKEAIEGERQARKEALQEIKLRMDADRAEMRAQFAKLSDKIDALIRAQGGGK